MTIVEGEDDAVLAKINRLSAEDKGRNEKVGIIATDETMGRYYAHSIKSVGMRNDEVSIARNLYRILREFDDEGITVIYSESFAKGGIGQAIMNRLLKAAGHNILQA